MEEKDPRVNMAAVKITEALEMLFLLKAKTNFPSHL